MLINDHFHCRVSFDSDTPLTEMCAAAQRAGIAGLCLTDHEDLVDEKGNRDRTFSWEKVNQELEAARRAFSGGPEIRKGVELGQAVVNPAWAAEVLQEPDIDFVLGSMHNSCRGIDFYYIRFTSEAECRELLDAYLEDLLRLSRTDLFDSLAHLDYPLRYMVVRDRQNISLRDFSDKVDTLLRVLIERGKALEINTSGYRQGMGGPLPPRWVLERYRELGGDLITIGTDAHEPKDIAAGLAEGMELLRACRFRYITRFQKRRPEQIKI